MILSWANSQSIKDEKNIHMKKNEGNESFSEKIAPKAGLVVNFKHVT